MPVFAGAFLSLLVFATPGWAVQSHGGTEGLVAHQLGHFLFVVGLFCLLFRLYSIRLQGQGWVEFKIFLWLLISWNLMTFSGHLMNEFVPQEKFIRAGGLTLSFVVENFWDALFYLTRLDHILLVPSFTFLLLALRKWRAAQ